MPQVIRRIPRPDAVHDILFEAVQCHTKVLAYGRGRSYGDSCLNPDGFLLDTSSLDCIIDFNPETGILRAETGITLGEILRIAIPHGWFLPVVPGTKWVSLGGAIANDVHGKNRNGSFGHHLRAMQLLNSDGSCRELYPGDPIFLATVGGLGLTGFILWAEIQLKRIVSCDLEIEIHRFKGIDQFLDMTRASQANWSYIVAWVDAVNLVGGEPRGLLSRANFCSQGSLESHSDGTKLGVPTQLPAFTLNRYTVGAFNRLYYGKSHRKAKKKQIDYHSFFFPLDRISHWNRIYGPKGFYQHQCVVPFEVAPAAMHKLFDLIANSGQGSFLSVLKQFGTQAPIGMMSFPIPGVTLALDFRNRGRSTLALLDALDRVVLDAGGRVYPAKDGRLSSASYKAMFPRWQDFSQYIDPAFSSAFWRRVTAPQSSS